MVVASDEDRIEALKRRGVFYIRHYERMVPIVTNTDQGSTDIFEDLMSEGDEGPKYITNHLLDLMINKLTYVTKNVVFLLTRRMVNGMIEPPYNFWGEDKEKYTVMPFNANEHFVLLIHAFVGGNHIVYIVDSLNPRSKVKTDITKIVQDTYAAYNAGKRESEQVTVNKLPCKLQSLNDCGPCTYSNAKYLAYRLEQYPTLRIQTTKLRAPQFEKIAKERLQASTVDEQQLDIDFTKAEMDSREDLYREFTSVIPDIYKEIKSNGVNINFFVNFEKKDNAVRTFTVRRRDVEMAEKTRQSFQKVLGLP